MTVLPFPVPLHVRTPLVYAPFLSGSGHNVFLKLETQQLSGSFKIRGIGRACLMAHKRLGDGLHIVCASGGNAGLAAAAAASRLKVKATVFVHLTTELSIIERLKGLGADVRPTAGGWEACNAAASALVATEPIAVYIHPFEGDDVVRGHSSLVEEIMSQFPDTVRDAGLDDASSPDVLCCSVGGGGLIRGLMLGLTDWAARTKSTPTHVLGMCTVGADSFARSLETEDQFVTLEDAHSKAMSLAAKACSPSAVQDARAYGATGSIQGASKGATGKTSPFLTAVRAPDAYAGAASWQYRRDSLDDTLIELGCGAALIPAYQPAILDLIARTKLFLGQAQRRMNVVIIACGGSRVSAEDVDEFEQVYGVGSGQIFVDGALI